MTKYIALLRGINVSGQKKIIMSELRTQLTTIGFENVETYIQTGNIIFNYKSSTKGDLVDLITNNIKQNYGFDVPCMILEPTEIQNILIHNPFLTKTDDIKYLHVSILSETPNIEAYSAIKVDSKSDEYHLKDKHIYIFTPGGYGKTKLNNNFFEIKLKQKITTRNWKTMSKLLDMTNISS